MKSIIPKLIKICMLSLVIGIISGAVGGIFHRLIDMCTEFRMQNTYITWFLPVGGLAIIGLYHLLRLSKDPGTNRIIDSVNRADAVPFAMAPLIFIATCLTHLFGGSAGREGAALQLGGSIGYNIGKKINKTDAERKMSVMCGMSGVFSALFGTPLTAALFTLEVASVGMMNYSALVPCIFSAYTATAISRAIGNHPVAFNVTAPVQTPDVFVRVIILALLCAAVSILFCLAMKHGHKLFDKVKNPYIRIAAGGLVIAVLPVILGTYDYNGAGMNVINRAFDMGEAVPWAFLLKIVFTVITIGVGFKGGEIVPTFFIGATFGCFVGGFLGIAPSFGAAVGLVATFCGVVNCPIASIILSIELYGSQGLLLYALAVAVSYWFSGRYSLYSSQHLLFSKLDITCEIQKGELQ